jgi:hypothetical protein
MHNSNNEIHKTGKTITGSWLDWQRKKSLIWEKIFYVTGKTITGAWHWWLKRKSLIWRKIKIKSKSEKVFTANCHANFTANNISKYNIINY